MKETLIVSSGHNDKDPGAIGNGYKESEVNILIKDAVLRNLKRLGVTAEHDENWETNSQFQSRIRTINKTILEIHLNAGPATANGSEVIISSNASSKSKTFAEEILNATCKILNTRKRGILKDTETPRKKLGILNMSGLAALIEVCFITNAKEMERLMSPGIIEELGCEYAHILLKYDQTKDNQPAT